MIKGLIRELLQTKIKANVITYRSRSSCMMCYNLSQCIDLNMQ